MNHLQFEMLGRQRSQLLLAEAENERLVASLQSAEQPSQTERRQIIGAWILKPRLAGLPG
jgi:hypothetical protein